MKLKIQISPGNIKTGRIPAISLPPIMSCPKNAPCARWKECYALRMYKQYKETKAAWDRNLKIYNQDPLDYFNQIKAYLLKKKPPFFRWHVSGDIPDKEYLRLVRKLCRETPEIKHLLFTKRYSYNYRNLPKNFTVIFSLWTNYGPSKSRMPKAWMFDPKNPDPRIPKNALQCPGNCETCGLCWHLKNLKNKNVVFPKHGYGVPFKHGD